MKIASLDAERDPHPQREERLKNRRTAAQGAEEMQRLMRQVHRDQDLRTAVVARARTQLDYRAPLQRRAARMRKVKHYD
jgi:hypothetical protein